MRGSVYYQSAELTKTFKSSRIFLRFEFNTYDPI